MDSDTEMIESYHEFIVKFGKRKSSVDRAMIQWVKVTGVYVWRSCSILKIHLKMEEKNKPHCIFL